MKPYLLTSVTNNLGAPAHADLRAVDEVLPAGPRRRHAVADAAAVPGPRGRAGRRPTTRSAARATSRSTATTTASTTASSASSAASRGSTRSTPTRVPAAVGHRRRSPRPRRSSEDEFELPPVLDAHLVSHRRVLRPRRHRRAPRAASTGAVDPQAPQLGARRSCRRGASAEELREACRALRGRVLRQEVYAQDGTPAAATRTRRASTATRSTCCSRRVGDSLRRLLRLGARGARLPLRARPRRPAGRATSSRSRSTPTATSPARRRSATRGATPAYRRAGSDAGPLRRGRLRQRRRRSPDWYRIGLPTETRDYELTGVAPDTRSGLYRPDDARDRALPRPRRSPTRQHAGRHRPQRRLLARTRTHLPQRRSLRHAAARRRSTRSRSSTRPTRCATRPGCSRRSSARKLSAAELAALLSGAGAFVDLDGDGNQWAPSPRLFYSPDPATPKPATRSSTSTCRRGRSTRGGTSRRVAYDDHNLLVVADHRRGRQHDARAAATTACSRRGCVTDPNLNRSGVRYDALGMVVATAAMGKLLRDGDRRRRPPRHEHRRALAQRRPDDPPRLRPRAYATWAAEPDARRRPSAPVWVQTAGPCAAQGPGDAVARVLRLQRRPRARRAHQGAGRARRSAAARRQRQRSSATRRASSCSRRPQTRWVGSGRVVYDNKGNPVKAYEPFFDSSPVYDDETDLVEWGVTSITRYDPLGRLIRVDNPNGTLPHGRVRPVAHRHLGRERHGARQRLVRRAPGGRARRAAKPTPPTKAAAHANTPASSRPRHARADVPHRRRQRRRRPVRDRARRSTSRDTPLSTTDALGRAVLTQDYDMAGAEIHQRRASTRASAGCSPTPAASRCRPGTAAASVVALEYDALRRPTDAARHRQRAARERLAEQVIYGEALARRAGTQSARRRSTSTATRRGSRDDRAARLQGQRARAPPASCSATIVEASTGRPHRRSNARHVHDHDHLRRAQPAVPATTPDGSVTDTGLQRAQPARRRWRSTSAARRPRRTTRAQRHLRRQGAASEHRLRQRREHRLHLRPARRSGSPG